MRVKNDRRSLLRLRRDDEGATAVIVVLSLVALLGVIVLTVDVGQLLFNRRAMVGSSAGSLSGGWTYTQNRTCDDSDANKGQQVTIQITNSSLSGPVQDAFQVSIPFLPPLQLNPVLRGSFRCE